LIDSPAVVVVDAEGPNKPGHPDGTITWAAMCQEFGIEESKYMTVSTPSAGAHIYMSIPVEMIPAGKRIKTGMLAGRPGIEVRAAGSYVLIPGSEIDGRDYGFIHELIGNSIHEMPVALAQFLIDNCLVDIEKPSLETPNETTQPVITQTVYSLNNLISSMCASCKPFRLNWTGEKSLGDLSRSAFHYNLSISLILRAYSDETCRAVCKQWDADRNLEWKERRFQSSLWGAKRKAATIKAAYTQTVQSLNNSEVAIPAPAEVPAEKRSLIMSHSRMVEVFAGNAFPHEKDELKWTESNLISVGYFSRLHGFTDGELISLWNEWLGQFSAAYSLTGATYSRLVTLAEGYVKLNSRGPVARTRQRCDRGQGDRELESKKLFQAGKTNAQVAKAMGISEITVRRYRSILKQRGVVLPKPSKQKTSLVKFEQTKSKKLDILAQFSVPDRAAIKKCAANNGVTAEALSAIIEEQKSLLALELQPADLLCNRVLAAMTPEPVVVAPAPTVAAAQEDDFEITLPKSKSDPMDAYPLFRQFSPEDLADDNSDLADCWGLLVPNSGRGVLEDLQVLDGHLNIVYEPEFDVYPANFCGSVL
jgi:transposase